MPPIFPDHPTEFTPDSALASSGAMSERLRTFDWSQSPIGPVERWPMSLHTAVSIVLGSQFPMSIWWGPELALIYNDAGAPILGSEKDRTVLGRPGREIGPDDQPQHEL